MSHLKLGVEVAGAHGLLAKDREGTSNAFVEIHFDGQKFRTTIKDKDLNPLWDEHFFFNISDPNTIPELTLEAYVYHQSRFDNKKVCLGKVCLTGTSFVPFSDAVLLHYPLEKPGVFSRAKGELGLRVYVTNDPYIRSSNPLPAVDSSMADDILQARGSEQASNPISGLFSGEKAEKRRTFRHLPTQGSQPQPSMPMPPQAAMNYANQEMRGGPPLGPRVVYSGMPQQPSDYSIRETSPNLGGSIVGGQTSTHDLVETVNYLFVRVVKARDLPSKDITGSLDPYVEVKMGNYKGRTKYFEKNQNPEWNEVFAFSNDQRQAHILEVKVKDKDVLIDEFVGCIKFDLHEVPTRVPPDSPLAPEWYRLEDKNGEKKHGELMVAVWNGTQADEAFADAWHADTVTTEDYRSPSQVHTRSKVYQSPRLWYVRVNVISAQDLMVSDKHRFPDVYAKVQIGNQIYRTKTVQARNLNPMWNEEMMLVAAEPFEDHLIVSVEDRLAQNKDEMLGKAIIPLTSVSKRVDDKDKGRRAQWYELERSTSAAMDGEHLRKDKFFSRVQLMVYLEGGYHVLDESTHYSSDLRPTARQLWKSSIGVLELGILSADGLQPMKTRDGRGTSDTFCVAKYGQKWVRTRTIVNNLSPKYNEQYTWEVYDPATVVTVGVFDNGHTSNSNGSRDTKIGKVRIRISTLETGRVYTNSYPLLVLHPSGVKKMGELHLAIRFSCTSVFNLMLIYSRPLLPKMHYVRPLNVMQQEQLRLHAVGIVAGRLARAEPPLKREVVEYMSDVNSHLWSMRRSKANFFRLMNVFSGLLTINKWFGEVCQWKNPVTTVLVHILLAMLVYFPELILPTAFLYMCLIGVWNYYYRPRFPPHMDTRISHAVAAHQDELDEEFDTFPTTRSPEIVRMRYDRLRHVAGRIQSVVGDVASQGERIQHLLSWRDTRASAIFILFCFIAAIFLYVTPFQLLALFAGCYIMRHPRFRRKMPSAPINFFRRLPAKTDSML